MTAAAFDIIMSALAELGIVSERDGKARAQCPAHGSQGLSLIVSRRQDSAGVYCFAGCETADVMAALGLGLHDLFDDAHDPLRRHLPRPLPRPERNPIGDPDHFCDRIIQQERLEADPAYRARRAAELEWAKPRPGDYMGRGTP